MRLARVSILFDRRPRVPDGKVESYERWLRKWREDLTYLSECKYGGSSFEEYDVEGRVEAIKAIPTNLLVETERSNPRLFARNRRRKG